MPLTGVLLTAMEVDSLVPFFFFSYDLEALFPISESICQEKNTTTNCVIGQYVVCELNPSYESPWSCFNSLFIFFFLVNSFIDFLLGLRHSAFQPLVI